MADSPLNVQLEEALLQYVGEPITEDLQACLIATVMKIFDLACPDAMTLTIENLKQHPDGTQTCTILLSE